MSNFDSVHKFSETTVFYCNRGENIGDCNIYLSDGKITFEQNNISNNFAKICSGIWMTSSTSTSLVNFSLFDKNDATSMICGSSISVNYKNSIFSNNKVIKAGGYPGMLTVGDLSGGKSASFDKCIFVGNNQGSDSLFGTYNSKDSITITKSYILLNSTIHSGDGKFQKNNMTLDFQLDLDHNLWCLLGDRSIFYKKSNELSYNFKSVLPREKILIGLKK